MGNGAKAGDAHADRRLVRRAANRNGECAKLCAFMDDWEVSLDPRESQGVLLRSFLERNRPDCSLGLSRGSSASNRGRLRATIAWLGERCRTIAVVEGSYLGRWNRMAWDGASENGARREAEIEASTVGRRIERVLREAKLDGRARLLDWAELVHRPEVRTLTEAIEDYAASNSAFEASLRREVGDYVARARGLSADSLPDRTRGFLRGYVVEEVAVLLELQRLGHPVEVYHGPDLPLLAEITEGRFKGVPFACPKRTHVSLRLTSRISPRAHET
jgi:tRNA-dependent cyclodipeptide synthase